MKELKISVLIPLLGCVTGLLAGASASAQAQGPAPVWGEVFVGSELESYLRAVQLADQSRLHPWSIRGFGPGEVQRLAPGRVGHPWADRYDFVVDSATAPLAWVRPAARLLVNSAFPYGSNDGAIWSGKGVTVALEGGVAARIGPLSAVLAPIFFAAQNASFELMPNGEEGDGRFRDPRNPDRIDLPQRFGTGTYARADPGQSGIRLDLFGGTIGFTTANQNWGPARTYPILLGHNAPGFAHAFIGTSVPVGVGIGNLHARVVWGSLAQSRYSPAVEGSERRLMSGFVATFSPWRLDGLELGVARFFHSGWPRDGWGIDQLTKPFEGFLKSGLGSVDALGDNQLASVFARWAHPASGFEIYGEFAREDHNFDFRDFMLEPDHDSAYTVGFQRIWSGRATRWWSVRGEVTNGQRSHLDMLRHQSPFYRHTQRRQGHTNKGQLLGSPAVYGGSGAILAVDYLHSGGRWTGFVERILRNEEEVSMDEGIRGTSLDVMYALGLESLLFLGRFDVTGGVTGAMNLNRDFSGHVFNLNARLLVQVSP